VAADNGAHTLPPAGGARTAAAAVDADAGASPPAPTRTAGSSPPSSPAPGSPPGDGWVKVEGRFASIMCVVTSCISDKSRAGLVPEVRWLCEGVVTGRARVLPAAPSHPHVTNPPTHPQRRPTWRTAGWRS
jgi:hypothetical protein